MCSNQLSTPFANYDFRFLSTAARNDLCSPTVPIGLLADVFDVITLNKCEGLFGFVESNVAIWKEAFFFQAIKNNLLRICNGKKTMTLPLLTPDCVTSFMNAPQVENLYGASR